MGVHDAKIRQALTELDIDQAVFAVISGVTPTRLSQAFRGTRDFCIPEILSLNELIAELRQIAQDAAPFPVAFRNVEAVRRLLEQKRGGVKWSIAVEEVEDEEEPAEKNNK
jgi:hypothetical protein